MRAILLIVLLCLYACSKSINADDVIQQLDADPTTVDANGASVKLTAVINPKASDDRKNVIFTTTGGSLVNAAADGTLNIKADFVDGKLTATATLKAPFSEGTFKVTAAPATTSPNGDYSKSVTITASAVLPTSIDIQPSSFGIGSNFTSEDTLVATLKNGNKKVSQGAKVVFDDNFENGAPVHGQFRQQQLSSNASSQVSAIYSAPALAIGTQIFLTASIVDPVSGEKKYPQTIVITINK